MPVRRIPHPKKYLTVSDLRDRWGVSQMFIERGIRLDPQFPTYSQFGDAPKAKRLFDLVDVETYERSRVKQKSA